MESQDNGSGWTLHSISYVHLLLVLNPRNISSSGLRALVGGLNYDYELDMGDDGKGKKKKSTLILDEAGVDGGSGDFDDDEMENEVNEYDVTDKFVDDSIIEADDDGDVSFYLQQNSKRRRDFDDEQQQAGPSKKKSRLEEIIENYDSSEDQSIVFDGNEDGQLERNNVIKRGREKKNVGEDVIEIDEGGIR